MDDLELTKLCAEAMGIDVIRHDDHWNIDRWTHYQPLHDDAQAMALVKKFRLQIWTETIYWLVADSECEDRWRVCNADLNRAIVECVAKLRPATQPHQPAPGDDAGTRNTAR